MAQVTFSILISYLWYNDALFSQSYECLMSNVANMTTTKIDRDSLQLLRMIARRNNRSSPAQLAVLVSTAFRTSPSVLTDQEIFSDMMDSMVEKSQAGEVSEQAAKNAEEFTAAGRISWGEDKGVIVGVLADGSRCDVDGNVIIDA